MKIITAQQLENTVEQILHDREEVAKIRKELFEGVSQADMQIELKRRLGDNWVLKKEQPLKLTKDDLNTIANSRFYKRTGIKLLMGWAITVLALLTVTVTYHWLPLYVMYILSAVASFVFVFLYSKKQREARREFWRGIGGGGVEKEEGK